MWLAMAMIAGALVAVAYVLFAATSKPEAHAEFTRFAKGGMARLAQMPDPPLQPTRALVDAEGAETNLQAYRGDVLVVNLWATWCAPCVEEMPTLGALQRNFEGRGVRVIAISVDTVAQQEEAKATLARLSENALPFVTDPTRGVLFDTRAAGMPVTILYDRQGRERARVTGGADWGSPEAAGLVEALLAE